MIINNGNIKAYKNKEKSFYENLKKDIIRNDKIFIPYHSDADGIISGAMIYSFIKSIDTNKEIYFRGYEQFRETEFEDIKKYFKDKYFIIFAEGWGLSNEYNKLDESSVNIDHHPVTEHITRILNPREFAIEPNPSNSQIVWELLKKNINPDYEITAAFASIMDYCNESAADIISKHKKDMKPFDDIKDIFLSCQYISEWTNRIFSFLIKDPNPVHLVSENKLKERRDKYRKKIEKNYIKALELNKKNNKKILLYKVLKDDIRIASPLATRLADKIKDKIVAIGETNGNKVRLSIRNRNLNIDIGNIVCRISKKYSDADGTGHKKAASARLYGQDLDKFISEIEEMIK